MTRVDRRHFLQLGTWGGLGAYLARGNVFAQANEKINVGFIGVGGKGRSNLRALAETENVVALCDVDENHLAAAAADHAMAHVYTDWRKLLEQPHLDAVVVTVPDHSHAVASCAAMKLGKHVYCEKPLARSVFEVRTMTELAAQHPKLATQMGNAGHSSSGTRRVVELVQSGAIGKVTEVHCWTNRPIWPQGLARPAEAEAPPPHLHWDLWLGPAPARPFHYGAGVENRGTYHPFNWRGWWDFGTGALGDMGCHIIDAPYWALGLAAPRTISTEAAEPKQPETGPLWMIVRYEFPARGAPGKANHRPSVKLTWYDGGKLPPIELFFDEPQADNGILMIGDKGTLYIPRDRRGEHVLLPRDKFIDFQPPEPTLPTPTSHYAEWTDAIRSGGQTLDNFAYAGPLTEAVLLGNVAHRLGQSIEWESTALRVKNGGAEAAAMVRPELRKGWTL